MLTFLISVIGLLSSDNDTITILSECFALSLKIFFYMTADTCDVLIDPYDIDVNISINDPPINITSYLANSDGKTLNVPAWFSQPLRDIDFDRYMNNNLIFSLTIYVPHDIHDYDNHAYNLIIFPISISY